jgi:hypothetical protein
VLTDIHILIHYQEYLCCSEPSHTDAVISLRDISQICESHGEQPTFIFLLRLTFICTWPCYVTRRIFCLKPKYLEIFGLFGSELVRLRKEDMPVWLK